MEWNEKFQLIIDYVKNHLQRKQEPIHQQERERIADCSFGFFQKVFSYMNGINIYNTDKADSRKFEYLIAVSSDCDAQDELTAYTVPAMTYMETHLMEELRIEQISNHVFVSKSNFQRVFHMATAALTMMSCSHIMRAGLSM